jgi:hypothetical protein
MSDDFAVDSQVQGVPGAGLPESSAAAGSGEGGWREHVRELRAENARRRKENQELRGQLATLANRGREAEDAQAAASARSERDVTRLARLGHRLKELELHRLTGEAVAEAAERRRSGGATAGLTSRAGARREGFRTSTVGQANSGTAGGLRAAVDVARVQRLLERVPTPVDVEADLVVDDEGQVSLAPEATERLRSFVEEMVDLSGAQDRVAPPPVGGEPPRATEPGVGRIVNAWDPDGQQSPAGRARAALREAAAQNATVLDGLAQL